MKKLVDKLVTVAIFVMVASYLPQLILTYSTRNVEGQSIAFWGMLVFSLLVMTLQQFYVWKDGFSIMGFVFQSLNTILALAMLIAVIIF